MVKGAGLELEPGLTRSSENGFNQKRAAPMPLPLQIERRLATLGVRPADVDERFVRGTGPGGQKINKTSSTVLLRHLPTGTEVRCQAGRSQTANRAAAWLLLCDKLETACAAERMAREQAREVERRRTRQKSRGQKVRMIEAKKHRAKIKAKRGRGFEE
jgi:protein subunit release factor B